MQAIQQNKIKVKITLYIIYSIIVVLFIALLSIFFNPNSTFAEPLSYTVSVEEVLNVSVSSSNIVLGLNPETKQFNTSALDVSVGTNYIKGYKLYINSTSTNLTNNDYINGTHGTNGAVFYIPTLDSGTTATASNFPTNHWGYRISSIIAGENSSNDNKSNITPYAPITSLDSTLSSPTDATYYPFSSNLSTLISSATEPTAGDTTTITFAAKADYDKPAGNYKSTFTFNAIANPITYSITYADNTGDTTVTNLPTPNPDTGMITNNTATLSSTIPTRTGYTFSKWCLGTVSNNGTVCTGTEYAAGDTIDFSSKVGPNVDATLIATWTINSYLQTVQVRYQNASGGWGSYAPYSACTKDVNYGSPHSCSIAATTEYQAASLASYTVTGADTKYIDVYRNTRTVSLTKGTGISAVSFSGTGVVPNTTSTSGSTTSAKIYYGGAITIIATMASTYTWVNWTGSTTYSNRSQSISNVTGNLSFTANGRATTFNDAYGTTGTKYMQNMTSSICSAVNNGQTTTLRDSRDSQDYTVAKINGTCWMTKNLNIAGGTTLTPATSNVSSNYKLPNSSTSGFSDEATAYVYNNSTYGGYYSFVALTAGTNPKTDNQNASSDICPKNWHVSTRNDIYELTYTYEYNTMAKLVNQLWKGQNGGGCHPGDCIDSGAGSFGNYWTSTAHDSDTAYQLDYSSSGVGRGTGWKHVGRNVRCVAK